MGNRAVRPMPQTHKLTAAFVDEAPPGKYSDGGGLTLLVKPSGRRSWVARVSTDGKRRDIGLGPYPRISLEEARRRAAAQRAQAAQAVAAASARAATAATTAAHTAAKTASTTARTRTTAARTTATAAAAAATAGLPAARRGTAVPAFGELAVEVHALNQPHWRSERHAAEWLDSLRRHAAPLWDLPADRIARTDVLDVLHPIWNRTPAMARRVRQRIRTVLAYAMALHENIPYNAAGDGINAALPSGPKVRSHLKALHYRDVPEALRLVTASTAAETTKLCLRFLVLTAVRSAEARGARWEEIETAEPARRAHTGPGPHRQTSPHSPHPHTSHTHHTPPEATWRIPAERMKSGVEHRVPLSRQALDTLEAARRHDDGSGLVFPSPLRPGHPLSWQTLLQVLRTNEIDCTVHGFRSSFKTWTIETTSVPWAVGEAALAHTVGNGTEAAYVRGDLLEHRRELMSAWADFAAPLA